MALVARPRQSRERIVADCLSTDSVGDVVGISGPPLLGVYQVTKTEVGALIDMPGIGVVVAKPTSTTCIVQLQGEITGIYSGLTPGQVYFVGTASTPVPIPPNPTIIRPRIYHQKLGVAWSSDVLYLQPSNEMSVRVL
jgi:hypothetical protein